MPLGRVSAWNTPPQKLHWAGLKQVFLNADLTSAAIFGPLL